MCCIIGKINYLFKKFISVKIRFNWVQYSAIVYQPAFELEDMPVCRIIIIIYNMLHIILFIRRRIKNK